MCTALLLLGAGRCCCSTRCAAAAGHTRTAAGGRSAAAGECATAAVDTSLLDVELLWDGLPRLDSLRQWLIAALVADVLLLCTAAAGRGAAARRGATAVDGLLATGGGRVAVGRSLRLMGVLVQLAAGASGHWRVGCAAAGGARSTAAAGCGGGTFADRAATGSAVVLLV